MLYLYLYKVTLPQTGEYYIGRRKSRMPSYADVYYLGSMKSWKVNKSDLIKEIIKDDFLEFEDLCIAESILISEHITNPLCKNKHIPGIGFYMSGPHSAEHKKKISVSETGKYVSEETRKKQSNSRKNSKIVKNLVKTKEWRDKVSEGTRNSIKFQNNVKSKDRSKKISDSLFKSEKFKISRSSVDFKEKCSSWQKGKSRTPEYMEKFLFTRKINTTKRQEEDKNKIIKILQQNLYDLEISAKNLNLSEIQLKRKMKKYGIN